jgi:hypothetical protein
VPPTESVAHLSTARRPLRCGISIQLMSRWLAADMGLAGYRDGSECATVEQSCLGSRSSNTATGYGLWCLCNDHLLFHQSHNARPIFCCCHAGTTCKGGRMSISIPDEKMDDYARDCVVRLATRVDDKVLRERLLQMAREWKAAAMDEGNRSSAVT